MIEREVATRQHGPLLNEVRFGRRARHRTLQQHASSVLAARRDDSRSPRPAKEGLVGVSDEYGEGVEVLVGQGMARADAIRTIQITEQTFYRWRKQYGGMGTTQLKELKRLQKENERLRRAVSDLTLDKLILAEATKGNF